MIPFLKQVAKYIYETNKSSLHNITIVVPNRRSGVFFGAYLNEFITTPTISPAIISINELVDSVSNIQISDSIALLFLLHDVYQKETQHKETLDDFLFWGEILLNDFNDIDKYLLNADDLFSNITDLKEIDNNFDYLSTNQKDAIRQFWGIESNTTSSINRTNFTQIWGKLAKVYHSFRKELINKRIAYTGMFYREFIENWNADTDKNLTSDKYIFIGFNALNAAEDAIFKKFKNLKNSEFFWDYDNSFIDDIDNEAGLFMRQNIIKYPMPKSFNLVGNDCQQKISIVSVPGQIAQTQVINHPLFSKTLSNDIRFDNTAMILSDESLLMPIVSTAGALCKNINITMGYPIDNTPVFSFINLIIDLQYNYREYNGNPAFYHKIVISLLSHQLVSNANYKSLISKIRKQNWIYVQISELQYDELLKLIFQRVDNWQSFGNNLLEIISKLANLNTNPNEENELIPSLEKEYLFQVYLTVQQINDSLSKYNDKEVSLPIFFRFLNQALTRINIPFEGEPLSGLQIMGVLETRNIDFNRIFMFSVNEGRLPSSGTSNTFIPYVLRKAFNLPAYEEHDAMYAYYFYRILNRAEEIILVFDSSTEGMNTGEMSRYLYQLIYDSDKKIEQFQLNFNFKSIEVSPIAIESTYEHRQKLIERFSKKELSPSALNKYLECKLKFYFNYIANISETDELHEDIDNRLFGNLFHTACEIIYSEFGNSEITTDILEKMAKNTNFINKAINKAFIKEYFNDKNLNNVELTGKNKLIAKSLHSYIQKMLYNDKNFTPFRIISLENKYIADFQINANGNKHTIKLGGSIDRIDQTNNSLRIIDYKTGKSANLNFNDIDSLFDIKNNNRPKEIFQTLIYSEIYKRLHNEDKVQPAIYKITDFYDKFFKPQITLNNKDILYSEIAEDFNKKLEILLKEIFSDNNIFDQKTDDNCAYCPYVSICQRKTEQF